MLRTDGVLFPATGKLRPFAVGHAFAPVGKVAQYQPRVADYRDIRRHVLAYFDGVDVNVDYPCMNAYLTRTGEGSVSHSCAAEDEQISLRGRHVRRLRTVRTEHTEGKPVSARHYTHAHQRCYHRDIKLFGKGISWEAGTFIQVGVSFAGYWAGALFRTPAREKKSREAFFNDL